MTVHEITSPVVWERFQTSRAWTQFTQSWAWGDVARSEGQEVRRFALVDGGGAWLLAAQVEFRKKPLVGGYWFAPRGPVFSDHLPPDVRREAVRTFVDGIKVVLRPAFFIRLEPAIELGRPEGLLPLPFLRHAALNPMSTVVVDLEPDRDGLLATMKPKTRYNVNLAARHGITTRLATGEKDVAAFLDLLLHTAKRDQFVPHGRGYLSRMHAALSREGMARIRLAERDGQLLAGSMEILYGKTATYLHGASSSDGRNLMAPYALHWDAIMHAKRDGCLIYDFWGVNPESKAAFAYKPGWEGITRFKLGWGGRRVDLYGAWDLPRHPLVYSLVFPENH